jgi:DNA integrity scanning protein DisA with diadenylate cyclase activity
MITALISILVVALVLAVVYWLVSMFIQGRPLQIVGAILALILLLVALERLGLVGRLGL